MEEREGSGGGERVKGEALHVCSAESGWLFFWLVLQSKEWTELPKRKTGVRLVCVW